MKKQALKVGIIFMVIGITITPSTAKDIEIPSGITFKGNWLYVGGSGPGNYSRIQDAIDNASDSDTVFVYDDSSPYYENVIINKSIKLIGAGKFTTCIDAKKNGTVIEINADNVSVKDFTIQHSGRDDNAAVKLFGNNCTISNNSIIENFYGICTYHTKKNIIQGNEIKDNDRDGIELYSTTHATIQHNIISRIDGLTTGIHTVYCKNITIYKNMVNRTYHGIYISATTNATIHANSVTGCQWKAIMLANAPNNIIKNNSLRQSINYKYACDITLYNSSRCIVENNTLYSGVLLEDSYPNRILNNLVQEKPLVYFEDTSDVIINYSCGQIILLNCKNITILNQCIQQTVRAIHLHSSDDCSLLNNTITNNRQGIICFSSHYTKISNSIIDLNKDNGVNLDLSNNNKIYYNHIRNNEDYGLIMSGANNTIAHNTINDNGYVGFVLTGQNISVNNNIILRNYQGLRIRFLSNATLKQNILQQNTEYGLSISDSTNNTIAENIFNENENGIILDTYCTKHTIQNNDITENRYGLIIDDAYDNTITENNFINNKLDAFFYSFLCEAFFNKWVRNYWGHLKLIKIIWGMKTVVIFEHATQTYILFRFDRFPSQKPYDIPAAN